MKRRRISKSSRKYIRKEKARIRREVLDLKEQERLIQELYQKFFKIPLVIKKKPPFASAFAEAASFAEVAPATKAESADKKAMEGKEKIEQKTG